MITEVERRKTVEQLERTRQLLIDAVEGVTEEQARQRPAPDRWSIYDYVEHLAVSDDALVALVERALATPAKPPREPAKIPPAPRGANQAPHALRPSNRFGSLREALDAFLAARARTIEYARTTQADLHSHFWPHEVFGELDAYQWLSGNAHHVKSHVAHIKEIRDETSVR